MTSSYQEPFDLGKKLGVKRTDTECACCPYGFHIDRDFVRYAEDLASGNYSKHLRQVRLAKKRARKSMELFLAAQQLPASITSPAATNPSSLTGSDSPLSKSNDTRNNSRNMIMTSPTNNNDSSFDRSGALSPLETQSLFSDSLENVMSDFEETLSTSNTPIAKRKQLFNTSSSSATTKGYSSDYEVSMRRRFTPVTFAPDLLNTCSSSSSRSYKTAKSSGGFDDAAITTTDIGGTSKRNGGYAVPSICNYPVNGTRGTSSSSYNTMPSTSSTTTSRQRSPLRVSWKERNGSQTYASPSPVLPARTGSISSGSSMASSRTGKMSMTRPANLAIGRSLGDYANITIPPAARPSRLTTTHSPVADARLSDELAMNFDNLSRVLNSTATPPFATLPPSKLPSDAALQAIREQMSISLNHMRELEEQVRSIPALSTRINELKTEKETLLQKVTDSKSRLESQRQTSTKATTPSALSYLTRNQQPPRSSSVPADVLQKQLFQYGSSVGQPQRVTSPPPPPRKSSVDRMKFAVHDINGNVNDKRNMTSSSSSISNTINADSSVKGWDGFHSLRRAGVSIGSTRHRPSPCKRRSRHIREEVDYVSDSEAALGDYNEEIESNWRLRFGKDKGKQQVKQSNNNAALFSDSEDYIQSTYPREYRLPSNKNIITSEPLSHGSMYSQRLQSWKRRESTEMTSANIPDQKYQPDDSPRGNGSASHAISPRHEPVICVNGPVNVDTNPKSNFETPPTTPLLKMTREIGTMHYAPPVRNTAAGDGSINDSNYCEKCVIDSSTSRRSRSIAVGVSMAAPISLASCSVCEERYTRKYSSASVNTLPVLLPKPKPCTDCPQFRAELEQLKEQLRLATTKNSSSSVGSMTDPVEPDVKIVDRIVEVEKRETKKPTFDAASLTDPVEPDVKIIDRIVEVEKMVTKNPTLDAASLTDPVEPDVKIIDRIVEVEKKETKKPTFDAASLTDPVEPDVKIIDRIVEVERRETKKPTFDAASLTDSAEPQVEVVEKVIEVVKTLPCNSCETRSNIKYGNFGQTYSAPEPMRVTRGIEARPLPSCKDCSIRNSKTFVSVDSVTDACLVKYRERSTLTEVVRTKDFSTTTDESRKVNALSGTDTGSLWQQDAASDTDYISTVQALHHKTDCQAQTDLTGDVTEPAAVTSESNQHTDTNDLMSYVHVAMQCGERVKIASTSVNTNEDIKIIDLSTFASKPSNTDVQNGVNMETSMDAELLEKFVADNCVACHRTKRDCMTQSDMGSLPAVLSFDSTQKVRVSVGAGEDSIHGNVCQHCDRLQYTFMRHVGVGVCTIDDNTMAPPSCDRCDDVNIPPVTVDMSTETDTNTNDDMMMEEDEFVLVPKSYNREIGICENCNGQPVEKIIDTYSEMETVVEVVDKACVNCVDCETQVNVPVIMVCPKCKSPVRNDELIQTAVMYEDSVREMVQQQKFSRSLSSPGPGPDRTSTSDDESSAKLKFNFSKPRGTRATALSRASATKKLLTSENVTTPAPTTTNNPNNFKRGTYMSRSVRMESRKGDSLAYITEKRAAVVNPVVTKNYRTSAPRKPLRSSEALKGKVEVSHRRSDVAAKPTKPTITQPVAVVTKPAVKTTSLSTSALADDMDDKVDEDAEAEDTLAPLVSDIVKCWSAVYDNPVAIEDDDDLPPSRTNGKLVADVIEAMPGEDEQRISSISEDDRRGGYSSSDEGDDSPDEGSYDTRGNISDHCEITVRNNTFEITSKLKEALDGLATVINGDDCDKNTWTEKYVELEWLKSSATKSSNAIYVEQFIDALDMYGCELLRKVINLTDENGNTSLHYAVSYGSFDVVSVLLDSKACDINKQNSAGYTPLMLGALCPCQTETEKVVLLRLFQMGDINIRAIQHGQTALMLAASHGKLEAARLLLESGADVNIQDEDGSTALMCAAEHGQKEIVKLLLSVNDIDASKADYDKSTALSIAVENHHRDIGVLIYAHLNYGKGSVSSPAVSRKMIPGITNTNN